MYSPTLARRKEVRKGAGNRTQKHWSPGNFLSQLLKCKSLRQDMNFTCLLLSCCLASLPETITFFYFRTDFPRRKPSARRRRMLGLFETSCVCAIPEHPHCPGSCGERAEQPSHSILLRYEIRGNNSIQQVKMKANSSSHRTACTPRRFQSQVELVRTEKAETRS